MYNAEESLDDFMDRTYWGTGYTVLVYPTAAAKNDRIGNKKLVEKWSLKDARAYVKVLEERKNDN